MFDGILANSCSKDTPNVWVVMSHRAGENSQILALANALGWPFECKYLEYKLFSPFFLLGASKAGINAQMSNRLDPPWPDIVISAGARNEPVCRWIQKKADKHVRLVHVGRTCAATDNFDLIVTTPQYRMPARSNILENTTTLNQVAENPYLKEASAWSYPLADLPRPFITLVVGGHSGPYTFDRGAAQRLGRQASEMADAVGGSLLVTTSSRTPSSVIQSLSAAITSPSQFYQWTSHATDNPYLRYLALADSLIVTCDSVSMLSEACATGKPVYIFDLDKKSDSATKMSSMTAPKSRQSDIPWWQSWEKDHFRAFVFRLAMQIGPKRLTRDIRIVHNRLTSSGQAAWLGDEFIENRSAPPLEDLQRAVLRVKSLFDPYTLSTNSNTYTLPKCDPVLDLQGVR